MGHKLLSLAVTIGDPAGIGPDIAILAWQKSRTQNIPAFFVIGSAEIFRARAEQLGCADLPIIIISSPEHTREAFRSGLPVLDTDDTPQKTVRAGMPDSSLAGSIIRSIEMAVDLTAGERVAAVVTNPIAKHILMSQGFSHAGHTEFLAELADRRWAVPSTPVMLMSSRLLNVVPVTVHVPLRSVPGMLSVDLIVKTATITVEDFALYFGIMNPRLAVCGMNPHAGEAGALGREEIDVVSPAITLLKEQGFEVSGPHSADSLFHETARAGYDVALAMYHDQALIPFKTLSFEDGVNVTLGLPFIRTSPDHGTAFSLAGTGLASPSSFIAALKLAQQMYDHKSRSHAAS